MNGGVHFDGHAYPKGPDKGKMKLYVKENYAHGSVISPKAHFFPSLLRAEKFDKVNGIAYFLFHQ